MKVIYTENPKAVKSWFELWEEKQKEQVKIIHIGIEQKKSVHFGKERDLIQETFK